MSEMTLRAATEADRIEVAELVCISTNYWYQTHGRGPIFAGGPETTTLFFDVYEALDPGCCLVAENLATKRLMGSCFYRERSTHVSLGIMNAHPNYFGRGVARELLGWVIRFAEERAKPVRLVSSAHNLDSYSLYTKAGFTPRQAYQDMLLSVPEGGLDVKAEGGACVRDATAEDVEAMAALEQELCGIKREKDYRYFIENRDGIWHASVLAAESGGIDGFLVSVAHPGSNMLGPGVMKTDAATVALIAAELDHHRGRTPVFLLPVDRGELVRTLYGWGARNCEIHVHQVRGEWHPLRGVNMPTFMPETG